MLLKRYGIIFRDLLARETNLPKWRELQIAFRRLEDRGEIRGGRFIDGFLGEQFALPVAVESVRAAQTATERRDIHRISGRSLEPDWDPSPGCAGPSHLGKDGRFRDGVAVDDIDSVDSAHRGEIPPTAFSADLRHSKI